MSFEKGIFKDGKAEDIFWVTSELVEELLSYLDLTSIKHLAESHKVTRRILGNAFTWNRLIIQEGVPRGSDCQQLDAVHIRNGSRHSIGI